MHSWGVRSSGAAAAVVEPVLFPRDDWMIVRDMGSYFHFIFSDTLESGLTAHLLTASVAVASSIHVRPSSVSQSQSQQRQDSLLFSLFFIVLVIVRWRLLVVQYTRRRRRRRRAFKSACPPVTRRRRAPRNLIDFSFFLHLLLILFSFFSRRRRWAMMARFHPRPNNNSPPW